MSNSKSSGIYSITSRENGKRYIGSANRICDRWKQHLTRLKSGVHSNSPLQNHYNKYGLDDLLFAVVEIVEHGDLSLDDFKNLLLEREQVYLNNWEECHFNIMKNAHCTMGYKHPYAKNYSYNSKRNEYRVYYFVDGTNLTLGSFNTEEEAVNQVDLIKSMSDSEILAYWETNHKGQNGIRKCKKSKNYSLNKRDGLFKVYFIINSKQCSFGCHRNEKDAITEVEYLKTLSNDEKLNYLKNKPKRKGIEINHRFKNKKYYSYSKSSNKWKVRFYIDGKEKFFGSYITEGEAKIKVEEVKKELGGFD